MDYITSAFDAKCNRYIPAPAFTRYYAYPYPGIAAFESFAPKSFFRPIVKNGMD